MVDSADTGNVSIMRSMNTSPLTLFAINATGEFGRRVSEALSVPLARHEEREFEDGEHKIRPLASVRDQDVFVIQSLYSDQRQSVNDKLCRLLFFLGALTDASAGRITAVIPYLGYARKDQKSQTRDPVTTKYIARLIEAAGADRVVVLDVHNLAAFQNAFRIHTEHLDTRKLFARYFAERLRDREKLVVISPDIGGIKRVERFRETLERQLEQEIGSGFLEKARALGKMTPGRLTGEVDGAAVIVIDDMISTGGTLAAVARAARERGAGEVYAAAAHGVFVDTANELLAGGELDGIIVTDSVAPYRLTNPRVIEKLTVLPVAPLFAEAIARIHSGGSIVDLLDR